VPKKKIFYSDLEELKQQDEKDNREESNLDRLEKKASSLLKVSMDIHGWNTFF
jgi:hypothetical protein